MAKQRKSQKTRKVCVRTKSKAIVCGTKVEVARRRRRKSRK